jgi:hypothetical protein
MGGRNFRFLGFFQIFWSHNDKKQLVFSSKGQIHIQTIKFEFKRTNQDATSHYHLSAPTAAGSAGDTARTLSSGPTLTQAIPSGPIRWQLYRLRSLPAHLGRTVVPRAR